MAEWSGFTDGKRGELAVEAGFTCRLTCGGLFRELAPRPLKWFPALPVVMLTLPQPRCRV